MPQDAGKLPQHVLRQHAEAQVRHPGHQVFAAVHGDEDADGLRLAHRRRHPGRHLAEEGVRNDDADGANDNVCPAAGHDGGIFSGGALSGAGFYHGRGSGGVGADGGELRVGPALQNRADHLTAQTAALPVHNHDMQGGSPPVCN